MPMVDHKTLVLDDIHPDIAVVYADEAARDADTAFNTNSTNINKNVRVNAPLSIFKLIDVAPTFLDMSAAASVLASSIFTDNFLIKGDGTNLIQRTSGDGIAGLFLNETNDILSIRPGSGVTQVDFRILANEGTEVFLIRSQSISPSNPQILLNSPGSIVMTTQVGIRLETAGVLDLCSTRAPGADAILIRRSGAGTGDDDAVVALSQPGNNPGLTELFVGNRNPNSNVSGMPASLYFSLEAGIPELFFHRGITENNIDWRPLESVPERIAFSVDTTTDALGKNFQIYACTDTTAIRTITISNSTIALGSTLLPHRFTIKDETSNAGALSIQIFTESGLIDSNTMTTINSDDGAKTFYTDGTNTFIESEHTPPPDAVTFTGNQFDVSVQAPNPHSLAFSADGLRAFVVDLDSDNVFQYNLTLPFSMAVGNVVFSSFAFNFTSQENAPTTLSFNQDGTRMFQAGPSSQALHMYTLSVGFDLSSTVVSTGDSFNFAAQEIVPTSIEWKPDGTKFFLVGLDQATVFEYTVAVAFDLSSTVTFTGNFFSVSTQDTAPESLSFAPDGKRFFIDGTANKRIFEYSLTTPFSLASGVSFTGISFDTAPQGDFLTSMAFKPDGEKMFTLYALPNLDRKINEFTVFPAFSLEN